MGRGVGWMGRQVGKGKSGTRNDGAPWGMGAGGSVIWLELRLLYAELVQ